MSVLRLGFLILCWLYGASSFAASYVFPGSMPSGCSGAAGVYSCPALNLAWGDSIAIAGTKPAKITVNGKFDVQNAQINTAGSVSDLSLVVTGDFVCNQCQVTGSLAVGGQTSLANLGIVGGSVTTGDFVCDNCQVGGNLTASGQTNLKYKGVIGGSITATGALTLRTESVIGGSISAAGQSMVVSDVVKIYGDVTVGSLSNTGSSTYYGGSITATTGSVSLPNASVVVGNVTAQDKDGTITLASSQARVGGCVTVNSNKNDAINLGWQASVSGVCCSPGNSGCKNSCVTNNSGAAMPALCSAVTTPSIDGFSAIDSALASTAANFLTGNIYTKLAGVGFSLKIAALKSSQIQTGYVNGATTSVAVKLVDNSDGLCGTDATRAASCSACNGRSAVTNGSQNLSFAASDNGVKSTGNFTLAAAYSNLVAVISDGSVTSCSVDSFSVRPTRVSSVVSSASNSGLTGSPVFKAGSGSFTLSATVNAGNYSGILKIKSSAMQATGSNWKVGALSPAVFPGATGGASTSTASSSFTYAEVGNFRFLGFDPSSDTSSARSIYDDSWTVIDSVKSDCVTDSYANTLNSDGKYGCLFGFFNNTSQQHSDLFGRFVPDHFAYVSGSITSSCNTFTYMGQVGLGIAYSLEAQNSANAVTSNYSQTITPPYPVVKPTLVVEDQAIANQGCDLVSRIGGLPTAQWSAGVYAQPGTATASFSRPTTPLALSTATCSANRASAGGPFWLLDIGVTINDSDVAAGLSGNDMNAATTGVCSGTACTAHKIGTTGMAYGRLWLNNAYGSELMPLAVPLQAQYWTAAGWQKNTYDSCTALTQPTRQDTGNSGLTFYAPPDTARNALAPGEVVSQMQGSTAASVVLQTGDAKMILRSPVNAAQGPGSGNFGYVDIIGGKISPGTWLPASGNARACFGTCGTRSSVIYLRESY
jgi:hypothetical protein